MTQNSQFVEALFPSVNLEKKNIIYSGVLLAIHVELTALLFPFPLELIPITVVERPIAESFQQ